MVQKQTSNSGQPKIQAKISVTCFYTEMAFQEGELK